MENPCLTFIIASILESSEFLLIDVIHEIAHGWFGNAVTNATWEEMWLSEGLATYAQRRITTEAYSKSANFYTWCLTAVSRTIRPPAQDSTCSFFPPARLQVKLSPVLKPQSDWTPSTDSCVSLETTTL